MICLHRFFEDLINERLSQKIQVSCPLVLTVQSLLAAVYRIDLFGTPCMLSIDNNIKFGTLQKTSKNLDSIDKEKHKIYKIWDTIVNDTKFRTLQNTMQNLRFYGQQTEIWNSIDNTANFGTLQKTSKVLGSIDKNTKFGTLQTSNKTKFETLQTESV